MYTPHTHVNQLEVIKTSVELKQETCRKTVNFSLAITVSLLLAGLFVLPRKCTMSYIELINYVIYKTYILWWIVHGV